ncbi:MAG TPA: hypothetical protein VGC42_01645, partial [Kofleriaceae bacterium]
MDDDRLHAELEQLNRDRLVPGLPVEDPRRALEHTHARQLVELDFLGRALAEVRDRAAAAPRTPAAFIDWFEQLRLDGPGQGDPLFPWLAEHAELGALRWFLKQEVSGEAGFDDLVALTQIRMPEQAKLEL